MLDKAQGLPAVQVFLVGTTQGTLTIDGEARYRQPLAADAVAQRDGHRALGLGLADHVLVELGDNLARRERAGRGGGAGCSVVFKELRKVLAPRLGPVGGEPRLRFRLSAARHQPDHLDPRRTSGVHSENHFAVGDVLRTLHEDHLPLPGTEDLAQPRL